MEVGSIQAFENKFNQMFEVTQQNDVKLNAQAFDNVFMDSINAMKETQEAAKVNMADVLMGNADNAYSALIAMEKAGLQMQLGSAIRDKAVTGINQMLNMQV